MKRIKDFLLSVNLFILVFLAVGARAAAVGATFGDALIVLGICSLQGFKMWLDTKKQPDTSAELVNEINMLKNHMSSLMMKNALKPNQPPADQGMKRFF